MQETLMTPPVIGAALTLPTMERLKNWVFEMERDVEIQDFYQPSLLAGDWRAPAERYAQLLDGHRGRVGIHGPFFDVALDAMDPEAVALLRRRMATALDVCAATGATLMVVHSPFRMWDFQNLDGNRGMRTGKIARVVENMAPVVRRAEDQGVTLAIENVEDRDPADRLRLAEAFGSAAVRLSIDTGHAHCAHGSAGAPPADHFVRSAGAMLAHVHLQDTDGFGDRHWPPGEGGIHWPSLFEALGELPVMPRLLLELKDEGRLVEAAERLTGMGLGR
jgi:sugar phosphate isomerase/epimerase